MSDWASRALEAQAALPSDRRSWERFLRRLTTAAESGDARAMAALGLWLQEGLVDERGGVVSRPAPKKAVEWFRRAAEQRHPVALHALAYCYDMGVGVRADRQAAIALYRQAVRLGLVDSAINLAICYREEGNERAYKRWLQRAAEGGNAEAQLQLAEWRLTRRTSRSQKKQAIRDLRALVRRIKADRSGVAFYPDELTRAEELLELGIQTIQ
jgi:TPR repeat protein